MNKLSSASFSPSKSYEDKSLIDLYQKEIDPCHQRLKEFAKNYLESKFVEENKKQFKSDIKQINLNPQSAKIIKDLFLKRIVPSFPDEKIAWETLSACLELGLNAIFYQISQEEFITFTASAFKDEEYFEKNKTKLIKIYQNDKIKVPFNRALVRKYFPSFTFVGKENIYEINSIYFVFDRYCSKFFSTMIRSSVDNDCLEINLTDLKTESFQFILDYVTENTPQPITNPNVAAEVLKTLLKFDYPEIKSIFVKYCIIPDVDVDSILSFYNLGKSYKIPALIESAFLRLDRILEYGRIFRLANLLEYFTKRPHNAVVDRYRVATEVNKFAKERNDKDLLELSENFFETQFLLSQPSEEIEEIDPYKQRLREFIKNRSDLRFFNENKKQFKSDIKNINLSPQSVKIIEDLIFKKISTPFPNEEIAWETLSACLELKFMTIFYQISQEDFIRFIDSAFKNEKYFERNKEKLAGIYRECNKINNFDINLIEKHFPNITFVGKENKTEINSLFLVLNHSSMFFTTMARSSVGGNCLNINLTDLEPKSFQIILEYITKKTITNKITDYSIAREVLKTLLEFDCNEIKSTFTSYYEIQNHWDIEKNVNNLLGFYDLAIFFEIPELKANALLMLRRLLHFDREISITDLCRLATEIGKFAKEQNDTDLLKMVDTFFKDSLSKCLLVHVTQPRRTREFFEYIKKELQSFDKETIKQLDFDSLILLCKLSPELIKNVSLSVSDEQISIVLEHLPPDIEELDLSGKRRLTGKTIKKIAKRFKKLKILNLEGAKKWNQYDPLESQSENWSKLRKLEFLESINVISSDAAPYLEHMLKKNAKHLKVLKMGNCQLTKTEWGFRRHKFSIDEEFCIRCLNILKSKGNQLEELDISGHHVPYEMLDFLSQNINIRQSLKKLSVKNNSCDDHTKIACLGNFQNLESIDLSGIKKLRFQDLMKILSQLGGKSKTTNIKELNISNTPIIKKSLKKFQEILSYCPNYIRPNYQLNITPIEFCPGSHYYDILSSDGFQHLEELKLGKYDEIHNFNNFGGIPTLKRFESSNPQHALEILAEKAPKFLEKMEELSLLFNLIPIRTFAADVLLQAVVSKDLQVLFSKIPQVKKLQLIIPSKFPKDIIINEILRNAKKLESLVFELDYNAQYDDVNISRDLFRVSCVDELCKEKSLKFLDVSTRFDQKALLKILQNNPQLEEIRNVDNCVLSNLGDLIFAVHLRRAPDGQPYLEVICRNKKDLKQAIKYVKSRYKYFTIIPKVKKIIGCEVRGIDDSLKMPVLRKKGLAEE